MLSNLKKCLKKVNLFGISRLIDINRILVIEYEMNKGGISFYLAKDNVKFFIKDIFFLNHFLLIQIIKMPKYCFFMESIG